MADIKVITSSQCEGNDIPKVQLTFDVLDDFKIDFRFTSDYGAEGMLIPFHKFDIEFEFFTKGNPETYTVSKVGADTVNCILIPEDSRLRCLMIRHNLREGLLYCNVKVSYYDDELDEGYSTVNETKFTGIQIVDSKGAYKSESESATASSNVTWEYNV